MLRKERIGSFLRCFRTETTVLVIFILLFLRYILDINIPVVVFLFFSAYIGLTGSTDDIIKYCLCCIPLSPTFQYRYGLLICSVVYFFRSGKRLYLSKTVFVVFLIAFFELFHVGFDDSLVEYVRSIAELLCLSVIILTTRRIVNYKSIVQLFAFSVVCSCVLMLVLQINKQGVTFLNLFRPNSSYRFGESNTDFLNYSFSFNPNALGFIINLAISGMVLLFTKQKAGILDLFTFIALVFFGIATMSRTFLVCFVLQIMLFILLGNKLSFKKIMCIFAILLVCIILICVVFTLMPALFENLFSRFNDEDLSNGRIALFHFYSSYIFSSWKTVLWGTGLQNYSQKVASAIEKYNINSCHNGIQEACVIWGLVCGLFSLLIFPSLLDDSRRVCSHKNKVQYIPFIVMLVNVNLGQFYSSGIALMALIYIYFFLSIRIEEPLI